MPGCDAYRPGVQPASGPRRFQMGTVGSVDAANDRVVLNNGAVVRLRPGARVDYDGRTVTIADLRPGDEIVIGVPPGQAVIVTPSADATVSALPRAVVSGVVIEGDELRVVRRPESP